MDLDFELSLHMLSLLAPSIANQDLKNFAVVDQSSISVERYSPCIRK